MPISSLNLHDQAEQVSSAEELASFVHVLLADYSCGEGDWTNFSLGLYLEAMAAWIVDMPGYFKKQGLPIPQKVEWKTFAQILLAAKYYE